MTKLLLVEDDQMLQESIQECLKIEGFEVILSSSLKEAQICLKENPDLVILDWMLPDGQGIELLRDLNRDQDRIPTIMLTARSDLIDKVLGLEMGADDYITKPFELRELVARIRVQLRKQLSTLNPQLSLNESCLVAHGITMNLSSMRVEYEGNEVNLTKMEYSLLKMFLESPGQVFSRDELLDQVWGLRYPTTRTVDMHIKQLRHKFHSELFETVHGTGYRFRSKS